jgi:hypothetical protein
MYSHRWGDGDRILTEEDTDSTRVEMVDLLEVLIGRTFLTSSVNPDILRMVIGRLSMRIEEGTATILCKIKSHRSVEMYTCSNTVLGRKRKNRWFCFFIFKTPPLFFYYNFSTKHVCLTIRMERCSPVR